MYIQIPIIRELLLKSAQLLLTIYLIPFLCFNSPSDNTESAVFTQAPVISINFYLMGRDSLDKEVGKSISENMDYLNREFEGKVIFKLNELHVDKNGAYLPTLHENYFTGGDSIINVLTEPIETRGTINVFLFDTYTEDGSDKALMGFTPVLRESHKSYQQISPGLDRILMAYAGLTSKTTLVHEMGHFLGLKHPWEMSSVNKEFMGLETDNQMKYNHMAYGEHVNDFTLEQLECMQDFAWRFRGYLVQNDYALAP